MKMIEIENLVHVYKTKIENIALNGLSFSINNNEKVAITGKSGSGKSTLIKILAGLLIPTAGQVFVDGLNLTELSFDEIMEYRRHRIGLVLQEGNLIDFLTVKENIAFVLKYSGMTDTEINNRINFLTEYLEIERYVNLLPQYLSSGEKQRVSLAVALANNPPIILADEPTGNLDYNTAMNVYDLLEETVRKFNHTLLLVSHDLNVENHVDRIINLTELKN